jgi:hypothetical protein
MTSTPPPAFITNALPSLLVDGEELLSIHTPNTPNDYFRARRQISWRYWAKSRLCIAIGYGLILISPFLTETVHVLFVGQNPDHLWEDYLSYPVNLMVILAMIFWLAKFLRRKDKQSLIPASLDQTFTLYATGMAITAPVYSSFIAWEGVNAIESTSKGIFFYLNSMSAFYALRRHFPTDASYSRFYETALDCWRKRPAPATERI